MEMSRASFGCISTLDHRPPPGLVRAWVVLVGEARHLCDPTVGAVLSLAYFLQKQKLDEIRCSRTLRRFQQEVQGLE